MRDKLSEIVNNKTTYWILGIGAAILLGFLLLTPQMRPPIKKPITVAPEVKNVREEPTVTVFRHETNSAEKMPLEKYLEGVVAAEIGAQFPGESLKAQAIVARTMTMAKIVRGGVTKLHNTDTCDLPEHFQAYDPNRITPKISQAVKATRGQVLLYDGKFAYVLFHSYAGSKTASLQESFPELTKIAGPYIQVMRSPGSKYAPAKERRWQAVVPKSELQPIFGTGANLDAIKITRKGPSGRAIDITAGNKTVKGYDLRKNLGSQRLKSTLISKIEVQGNNVVFTGTGWGHGCGMAQWGAYQMAKEGKTARQIVNYYFPKTQWFKAWS